MFIVASNSKAEDGFMITLYSETRDLPLPKQVYLFCGNLAYGCVPKIGTTNRRPFTDTCYLAYLVPLIQRTDTKELAPFHVHNWRPRFQNL